MFDPEYTDEQMALFEWFYGFYDIPDEILERYEEATEELHSKVEGNA